MVYLEMNCSHRAPLRLTYPDGTEVKGAYTLVDLLQLLALRKGGSPANTPNIVDKWLIHYVFRQRA